MSEKIIVMAFTRLREAGKVSNIQWSDIVAHDPTGRLASLRGVARKEAMDSATANAAWRVARAERFMIFSMRASSFPPRRYALT